MTTTEKTTIHDLAWDIAEEKLPADRASSVAWLATAGVPVTEQTLAYMAQRIRLERAKRGVFGGVSQ